MHFLSGMHNFEPVTKILVILQVVVIGISFIAQTCHCRPNILLFIVDDLRPVLSCYTDDAAITPNIDQLAEIGILFRNAYAQALCSPSRTSLLTSRRPDRYQYIGLKDLSLRSRSGPILKSLKLYDAGSYWRHSAGNYTTIPQFFKEHGYFTFGVGKVFHPGIVSNHSDDYPLSWSVPTYHGSTEKYKFAAVCPNSDGSFGVNLVCPVDVSRQPEQTLPDFQAAQRAIDFLNNYNQTGDQTFFLAVGFHKPHIPLKYPNQYVDLYPLESIQLAKNRRYPHNLPQVAWNPWQDLRIRDDVTRLNLSFPIAYIPDDFQLRILQSYFGATTFIDDLIGKIVFTLIKNSLINNTIIVFVGDHGWSLGEHGEWSKYSNFDVALRVPFIIVLPQTEAQFEYVNPLIYKNKNLSYPSSRRSGKQIEELVELVDLFPTLSDLSDLPVPELCPRNAHQETCTEGLSLKPIIINAIKNEKKRVSWKSATFSQYPRPSFIPKENSDQPKLKDIKIMGYSIKTKKIRYTEWIGFDNVNFQANWSQLYAKELYLEDNQDENLAYTHRYQKVVRRLSKRLRKGWRAALPPSDFDNFPTVRVNKEHFKRALKNNPNKQQTVESKRKKRKNLQFNGIQRN